MPHYLIFALCHLTVCLFAKYTAQAQTLTATTMRAVLFLGIREKYVL